MSYTGTNITAVSYNVIRNKIFGVNSDPSLATSYGFTGYLSTPATQGDLVSADQWTNLRYDINRAIIHQTGADVLCPFAIADTPITGLLADQLNEYADQAVANRLTVESGQLGSDSTNGTSYRASVWGSTITHVVTHVWNDAKNARQFFNLGGRITVELSYNNSSGSADDNTWIGLINTVSGQLSSSVYNIVDYLAGGSQTIASASSGDSLITVIITKSGSQLSTEISLVTTAPGVSITLDVNSVVTYYYSRGDAGPIPYGIPAPRPQVTTVTDLETGGTLIPVPTTRGLTFSPDPLSTFTFLAGNASASQTVTITNIGTLNTTVTSVYHSSSTLNLYGTFTLSVPLPWVIIPGGTRTFTVYYTAVNPSTGASVPPGTYNSAIVLLCDADAGNFTIPAVQTLTGAIFNATISPTSWLSSTTSLVPRTQTFTITPTAGVLVSYTVAFANVVEANARGFTVTSGASGPIVTHSPKSNGVYTAILNVVITGRPTNSNTTNTVSKSISISSTVNAITTGNLGSWISALTTPNAVIGASYDIINGVRYITLGFAAGSDGIKQLYAGGRVSINDLGISADSKYQSGVAMYLSSTVPGGARGDEIPLLLNYGVWIRSDTIAVYTNVTRNYKFTAPVTGTYTWNFTVDDRGFFTIDNVLMGDLRNTSRPWRNAYAGSVYLTAGQHSISFTFNNSGEKNTGIAIKIIAPGGALAWSTLDPVRPVKPYFGWGEVYRIPLPSVGTGVRRTYYSRDYGVKDGSMVYPSDSWGTFFGSGAAARSMFTVTDDGYGNLAINVNDRSASAPGFLDRETIWAATYAPYYYANLAGGIVPILATSSLRITQLPAENATQTKFFVGFLNNGAVNTVLKPIPTAAYTFGMGCPAPWHKVLLSNDESINAGDIKVGMMVKTQHATTMEWGDYAVTEVVVHEQSRMKIVFDHCEFTCSTDHNFHMQGSIWKRACDLTVGDVVSGHTVLEIYDFTELGEVVQITVDQAHTYVCEGMLSQNIIS